MADSPVFVRRTVRPWDEDGPQANLRFVPERLFLWFGLKSELRTVRPWGADDPQANSFFDQRRVGSLMGFKDKGRTVRPRGADGPLIS